MTTDLRPGENAKPRLLSRLTARLATTESELEDQELKDASGQGSATGLRQRLGS